MTTRKRAKQTPSVYYFKYIVPYVDDEIVIARVKATGVKTAHQQAVEMLIEQGYEQASLQNVKRTGA